MRSAFRVYRAVFFVTILLIGACVTINIYFPAEKVESVAGKIVEDIRGPQPEGSPAPEQKQQGFKRDRSVFAFMVSTAWAEDITTVSNPAIRELKTRMKDRYAQLKPWFAAGVLKEGDDGYVAIAPSDTLSVRDKGMLRNLVAAENSDRKSLYLEVAKALNIDAGQVDRIAGIFAGEWQKSVP
ncbi:MAG: DUF1318 domain-containing protein [Desulfobacterales bacterium]